MATLWARRYVIRPIRIFGGLAIAGAGAAALTFARIPIPSHFLVMSACLALAFAVNHRGTTRSIDPAVRRVLWLLAAALILAGLLRRLVFGNMVGAGGAAIFVDVETGVETLLLLIALVYITRGILADPGDRLLIGALAGLLSPVPVEVVRVMSRGVAGIESEPAWWVYPYWLLLIAALARANGNLRRP